MSDLSWDRAPIEEKLEMIREDIDVITEAHNRLGKDFTEKMRQLFADIEAIKQHLGMA